MKHKLEITRWANCPDNTDVWYRQSNDEYIGWQLSKNPFWHPYCVYIVDDEWSEIRKAFIDGKTIEVYDCVDNSWKTIVTSTWIEKLEYYRIKPDEPVYEWQWIFIATEDLYDITNTYYTEKEANINWEKYKPSKRIKK